jgi:hypothetical protein
LPDDLSGKSKQNEAANRFERRLDVDERAKASMSEDKAIEDAVLEHITSNAKRNLLAQGLELCKSNLRVVIILPKELNERVALADCLEHIQMLRLNTTQNFLQLLEGI